MISRLLSPSVEAGTGPDKFENLLGRLEQIVNDMENAEMPLEQLLTSYEEGMKLVKTCGDRLADAEQKVEILSKAATVEAPIAGVPSPVAETADEDEVRLF